MEEYIHNFETESEFNTYINSSAYTEPWVSAHITGWGVNSSVTVTYNLYELGEYLTFEIVSGGTLYWQVNNNKQISTGKTIEFKKNQEEWTSVTASIGENLSGTTITEVSPGDIIKFRGINASYYGAYGTYSHFNTDATFYVYGNIMSLIDYRTFRTNKVLTATETFYGMFENTNIKLHPTKKFLLPATTLADNCYGVNYPYHSDNGMFYNCTSLTTAPELPATTLAYRCYYNMFRSCTGLTTAPELPATTLANECYQNMFANCTNLDFIKCLATDISASGCLTNWVYRVQTISGTFVKNSSMTSWPTGASGIPTNWTVQDA